MFRLPAKDSRSVIVGSTGSGKTTVACWLLAHCDWHLRPWYIIDYKGDKLINAIGAKTISVHEYPPIEPGLYRLDLIPELDDEALAQFFWRVRMNENAGIYIDEGYMIEGPANRALKVLLTQGRSKNIQVLTLVQRPVFCSKFIFSEGNDFYVMRLQTDDDRKTVSGYLDSTPINRLPKFHTYWYSADDQEGAHLAPVPGRGAILSLFQHRKEQMAMERQKALEQFKSERFVAI